MAKLRILARAGNSNNFKEVPVGPDFNTVEEAYNWANNSGAQEMQDTFLDEYQDGNDAFSVEFS